ncbi:efflux RND transporter periplasmic adaptor subunit [Sulfurovum mangrovi]|uniref:efflux RND transporter periplasmic adaptor subunit n=1 Tax=Sulfurovum mangrovi TaxID=2893889 RepID=UPI001E2F8E39|nr:efflux RND transporter periplasmic adaptor subunit [Sulfurovum mangrovi]UFH58286.1 efflux RND transporter periplasmic adaptor subunit [Sulfurovum mangrovi]
MKPIKTRCLSTLLLSTLLLGLSGCGDSDPDKKSQASQTQKMPPLPVAVHQVHYKDTAIEKTYPAILKAYEKVDIVARVSGILEEKHFTEGAIVKKGDPLYTIEQDIYQAKLETAQAVLEKAQSTLDRAEKDWKRAKVLKKTNAISQKEIDTYLYEYTNAKAELSNAKANLKQAQIEYDYTMIKAPINGIAGIKEHDIGDYIQVGAESALLTTITNTDPLHAEFSIPKSDLPLYLSQIKKPGKVIKVLEGEKRESEQNGTIDFISPEIDQTTNTLLIRAKIDNPKGTLLAGNFVKVSIKGLVTPNTAVIPEEALLQTPKGAMVYVVEDGTAKIRPIQIGTLTKEGIIVNGGLKEGEKIIINNIPKVRPNANVVEMGK